MKTLKNHTLLFDDECPLCVAYTAGFIKMGMLDEKGRHPYNALQDLRNLAINKARAADEIALVNTKNQHVSYGLNSLLKVIGYSFPFIEKIARIKVLYFLLKKLYCIISYNRKVIISNPVNQPLKTSCEPSFNYIYRIYYLLFALVTSALILTEYSAAFELENYIPNVGIVLFIIFLQISYQIVFLKSSNTKVILNYAGHLSTVVLFGSLLLLPILWIHNWITLPASSLVFNFLLVVVFMFFHHKKRVENLNLSYKLSNYWVSSIFLVIILILFL